MKIAFVRISLASEDGDCRMMLSLAQTIKRLGHAVTIYVAKFDSNFFPELHKGLDVRAIKPSVSLDDQPIPRGIIGKIKAHLLKEKSYTAAAQKIGEALGDDFDVIISQNDSTYKLGEVCKSKNKHVKFVWIMNNAPFYHAHKNGAFLDFMSVCKAFWEKQKARYYAKWIDLVVVNDEERKELAKKLGRPVLLMTVPVDFDHFFGSVKNMPIGSKSIVLLGVGSLGPARKFEDIIGAVSELRKMSYDAQAIIVCRDFWGNAAYRGFLIDLTKKLEMEKFIDFRFDGASEEELRNIQKASTVFVFPNYIKISGMAAFEAMAAGLPLIVSRATSVAEILQDCTHALFTNAGDARDIAKKVKKLIDDPVLYGKIAEAGQKFVKENLNWDNYAKKLLTTALK